MPISFKEGHQKALLSFAIDFMVRMMDPILLLEPSGLQARPMRLVCSASAKADQNNCDKLSCVFGHFRSGEES